MVMKEKIDTSKLIDEFLSDVDEITLIKDYILDNISEVYPKFKPYGFKDDIYGVILNGEYRYEYDKGIIDIPVWIKFDKDITDYYSIGAHIDDEVNDGVENKVLDGLTEISLEIIKIADTIRKEKML